jgi:hypothetical protein
VHAAAVLPPADEAHAAGWRPALLPPCSVAAAACLGQQQCVLRASTDVYGDPCPGTTKALEMTYWCASCAAIRCLAHAVLWCAAVRCGVMSYDALLVGASRTVWRWHVLLG